MRQLSPAATGDASGLAPDLLDALLGAAHCGLAIIRAVRGPQGAIDDFVARWIEMIESQERPGDPRGHESEGREKPFRVRRVAVGDRIAMGIDDLTASASLERALGLLETRHVALMEVGSTGLIAARCRGSDQGHQPRRGDDPRSARGRLVGRTPLDPRWRAAASDGGHLPPTRLPAVITRTTGRAVRGEVIGIRHPQGRTIWMAVDTEAIEDGGVGPIAEALAFVDLTPHARCRCARGAPSRLSISWPRGL